MRALHDPEYAGSAQLCRACKTSTFWFCPGCRQAEGGEGGAGFYCLSKNRSCYKDNHRKRSVAALTHKLGAREEREVRGCHDLCVRTALSMVTSDEGCLSAVSKGLRDSSLWFSKTFMV